MAVNPQILCLDNYDYQKDIKEIIRQTEGKLVVIDNADILLDDDTRKHISLDDKNQYLIIGRNPKNLSQRKKIYLNWQVKRSESRRCLRWSRIYNSNSRWEGMTGG